MKQQRQTQRVKPTTVDITITADNHEVDDDSYAEQPKRAATTRQNNTNTILRTVQIDKWKSAYTKVRKKTDAVDKGPMACNTVVLNNRLTRAAINRAFPVTPSLPKNKKYSPNEVAANKRAKRHTLRKRVGLWEQQLTYMKNSVAAQEIVTETNSEVHYYPATLGTIKSLLASINDPVSPSSVHLLSNMATVDSMKNVNRIGGVTDVTLATTEDFLSDGVDCDAGSEVSCATSTGTGIACSSTAGSTATRLSDTTSCGDAEPTTTTLMNTPDTVMGEKSTEQVAKSGNVNAYLYLTMPSGDFLGDYILPHVNNILANDYGEIKSFLVQLRNNKWKSVLFRLIYPSLCSAANGYAKKHSVNIDLSNMNNSYANITGYTQVTAAEITGYFNLDTTSNAMNGCSGPGMITVSNIYEIENGTMYNLTNELKTLETDLRIIGGIVPYDLLDRISITAFSTTQPAVDAYLSDDHQPQQNGGAEVTEQLYQTVNNIFNFNKSSTATRDSDTNLLVVSYSIHKHNLANWLLNSEAVENQRYIDRDFLSSSVEELLTSCQSLKSRIVLK
jgi:hypothetical protein